MDYYRYLQDKLFEFARTMRADQEAEPVAIFVMGDVLAKISLAIPKNMWRETLVQTAQEFQAEAVILHIEAYIVTGSAATAAVAARKAGLSSLGEFPGRLEVFQSIMEMRDGSQRTLTALIGEDGTLGPTKVQEFTEGSLVEGPLANFFEQTQSIGYIPVD